LRQDLDVISPACWNARYALRVSHGDLDVAEFLLKRIQVTPIVVVKLVVDV